MFQVGLAMSPLGKSDWWDERY